MPRLLLVLILLTLSATPGFGQVTHTGRIEPGFINKYEFTPAAPGQLLATLSWDSSSASLMLFVSCTIEGEELGFGVAAGLLDRFARLEVGVLPAACEIGVITVTASANYTLNLQRTQPEPSTPLPPEAVPSRLSMVRTVIPGTSRGSLLERMAFRLERAARP